MNEEMKAGPCEKCGRRPKLMEGGHIRKWCLVCLTGNSRNPAHANLHVGIPERYAKASVGDLTTKAVETYRALPDDKGLLLWGLPGTGKTHAMCAFGRDLYMTGWEVARISYELLMLRIRDTYKPHATETELDIIEPLFTLDKLIVEDVGTTVALGGQESDFSLRTFLVVLDQRLERCKATYVTTNKSVEDLRKSFDARLASRLMQACEVIHLTGKDRRDKKA